MLPHNPGGLVPCGSPRDEDTTTLGPTIETTAALTCAATIGRDEVVGCSVPPQPARWGAGRLANATQARRTESGERYGAWGWVPPVARTVAASLNRVGSAGPASSGR
jgi:hypothetical protein